MNHASLMLRDGSAGEVVSHSAELLTDEAFGLLIRLLLAGPAAEHVMLDRLTAGLGDRPESDLAKATRLAANAVTRWDFPRCLSSKGVWLGQGLAAVLIANPRLASRVNQ